LYDVSFLYRFQTKEGKREDRPYQAINAIQISLIEMPIARCAPFLNPLLILVCMSEKKAGPAIRAKVSPKSIPCVIV
jgi:hypothetical protein